MKKIALGETFPIEIIKVTQVEGKEKYKVIFHDEEGFEGSMYLDVEIPIGTAELKIVHKEE
jgi:hypothetical protein